MSRRVGAGPVGTACARALIAQMSKLANRVIYFILILLLLQNLAGVGLVDQSVRVVLEKVPSTHEPFGGGAYFRDVGFVRPVTLLDGRSRVTRGERLSLRSGEGDKATHIAAD